METVSAFDGLFLQLLEKLDAKARGSESSHTQPGWSRLQGMAQSRCQEELLVVTDDRVSELKVYVLSKSINRAPVTLACKSPSERGSDKDLVGGARADDID